MLTCERIRQRDLVSKNVTHGIVYDQTMHERLAPHADKTPGLKMMFSGMELYLSKSPAGKMFHDPLAACVAVNRDIAEFQEVEVYSQSGEWGCRPASGTGTYITTRVDKELFFETLTGQR